MPTNSRKITSWPWLLAALLVSGISTAAPGAGQPAPPFSVTDTTGQVRSLDEWAGKTLVLEWTNHDCPFVKKHYTSGNMQALQKRAGEAGVVWLTVISSAPGKQGHVSPSQADALTASRSARPAAVLLDEAGVMGRAYDARVTPHMYIIDQGGKLAYMGAIDNIPSADPADIPKAEPLFAAALDAVLAGQPVAAAVTQPYGCSVKY